MAKKVKPIGDPPKFLWSKEWEPSKLKPMDLPNTAGIYMLIAYDGNGNPISQPGDAKSKQKGVVYLGLAGSSNKLKRRTADLARSWRPNAKHKKPPHGSRAHFNDDAAAQKLFKVENVKIRVQPLPTDSKDESPELEAYCKSQGMTVEQFRTAVGSEKIGDKLVGDTEANAIQRFKERNGYIPMLNKREEGKGDAPPTEAELEELLKRT